MPVGRLDYKNADPQAIAKLLDEDGCAVVEGALDNERLGRLERELAPYIEATDLGRDEFAGRHTQRTGGLIARSPACRELVMNPLVLGGVGELLSHASNFQLHLTQVISIAPGESAQDIHRDQWAFDFFPFPKGYEVQCNTIWNLDDFSEENGATRVIPGSHRREDKLRFKLEDTEPVEMPRGSILFYTGALYHGGGPNKSAAVRRGINITYNVAWLRQEENQYLSCPLDVAAELPEDLLRLMGYARGAYALGYVDDTRDPLSVLRPDLKSHGLGGLPKEANHLRHD